MNPNGSWQLVAGLSALGFYLFLSVGVAVFLWSRTKQRLAIQETLQKLIDKGTDVTPEVIESLRRPAPKQTRAEILAGVMKFRYWGYFLVGLGTVIALNGLRYSDSPVKDLREMTSAGIVTFARASVRRARVSGRIESRRHCIVDGHPARYGQIPHCARQRTLARVVERLPGMSMSDYDDIAQLFASAAPPEPSETFTAAVRHQIDAERRRAKVVAVAWGFAIAAVLAIVLFAVPPAMLYPVVFVQKLFMSTTGMIIAAAGAIVIAARLRLADA